MSSEQDETHLETSGHLQRPSGESPLTLKRVGGYELIEEVARGGMGVVYRAKQVSLNRIVAVKMIRHQEFASDSDRARFKAEAEAAAALSHANTVPIYEVGEHAGQPFFSMRLVEGGSLADTLASGSWSVDKKDNVRRAAQLMGLVALAVHDAHQHGIIHRDLKPGNILLDADSVPYVADFGVAKRFSNRDALTQTGSIVGTPAFMAPEQASGKETTIASDIYSLGAILYNLLSGRPPIEAATPAELFKQLLDGPTPPVRKWNRLVDQDLETICQKCLEKEPLRRYPTARALSEDLQNWQEGKPISARPIGPLKKLYRWSKRNPLNVAVTGMALLLGFVVLGTLALGYLSTNNAIDGFIRERYVNRIAQAASAMREGNPIEADSFLEMERARQDRESLIGWEWHYLKRKTPVETVVGPTSDTYEYQAAWSPDGRQFAVISSDFRSREFSVWKSSSKAMLDWDDLVAEPNYQSKLASVTVNTRGWLTWERSGKYLALSNGAGEVQIWDAESQSIYDTIACASSTLLAKWSQDGSRLAMVGPKGQIDVYDVATRQTVPWSALTLASKDSYVVSVAWGANDQWLAVADTKQTHFIDSQTKELTHVWPVSILDWNAESTKWISKEGIGEGDSELVSRKVYLTLQSRWSPDGRWIASCDTDRTVVIDAASGAKTQEFFLRDRDTPVWFPASNRVMIGNKVLRDLSWSPNEPTIDIEKPLSVMKASRNGTRVAVAAKDSNDVQVIDLSGTRTSQFNGHSSQVMAIDWSHDDRLIASLENTGDIRIWNVEDGLEVSRFTELTTENTSGRSVSKNASDWQVWWSPDDELLGASALGFSTYVWDLAGATVRYQLDKNNSRAIGWINDPVCLVIEIRGGSAVHLRTRDADTLEKANWCRMVNWEAASNSTHTYSVRVLLTPSQIPQILHDGVHFCCMANQLGYQLDTLESKTRPRPSVRNDSRILERMSRLELGEPSRLFTLSTNGNLIMRDVAKGTRLLWLAKCSPDSLLSYSAGKLWVADGKKVTIYSGTPGHRIGTSASGRDHFDNPYRFFTVIGILTVLFVGPIWILFDPDIRMTRSRRWIFATMLGGFAAKILMQHNWPEILQSDWSIFVGFFGVIFQVTGGLVGLGMVVFFGESLRLASKGRLIVPLLAWLLTILPPLLLIGYGIWPSAWQRDVEPTGQMMRYAITLFQFVAFLTGMALLALRFSSGNYSASLRFRSAPLWVRWSLWGCTSTRMAIVTTIVELIFYVFVIFLGRSLPMLGWILVGFGATALLSPIVRIFAIRWIRRNGGWAAQ